MDYEIALTGRGMLLKCEGKVMPKVLIYPLFLYVYNIGRWTKPPSNKDKLHLLEDLLCLFIKKVLESSDSISLPKIK